MEILEDQLEPITEPCDECSRDRTTSIPFIDSTFIGYMAPECPCGEAGDFSVARLKDEALGTELYSDLLSLIKLEEKK